MVVVIGRIRRVWVLGCGPAGLFAARAADMAGKPFWIYSKARKSQMFGAQYLHAPIPGLAYEQDRFLVDYQLRGTIEEYRDKVYGPGSAATTSPERLLGKHDAWDIRATYDRAWKLYGDAVENVEFGPGRDADLHTLIANAPARTLIVTSLPAPLLCARRDLHRFESASIWASGDAPEQGYFCPVTVAPDTVVCNGEPSPRWYRASNINGWRSVEWPGGTKPPYEHVAEVSKPIWTNCDCFPGVLRVGRYGTWTKGELSHQAYARVLEAL